MGASEDTTRAAFWVLGMLVDIWFYVKGEGNYAGTFYTGARIFGDITMRVNTGHLGCRKQDHMTVIESRHNPDPRPAQL
jgi:hypothetical protein